MEIEGEDVVPDPDPLRPPVQGPRDVACGTTNSRTFTLSLPLIGEAGSPPSLPQIGTGVSMR